MTRWARKPDNRPPAQIAPAQARSPPSVSGLRLRVRHDPGALSPPCSHRWQRGLDARQLHLQIVALCAWSRGLTRSSFVRVCLLAGCPDHHLAALSTGEASFEGRPGIGEPERRVDRRAYCSLVDETRDLDQLLSVWRDDEVARVDLRATGILRVLPPSRRSARPPAPRTAIARAASRRRCRTRDRRGRSPRRRSRPYRRGLPEPPGSARHPGCPPKRCRSRRRRTSVQAVSQSGRRRRPRRG
jgi:hypothetical protein